MKSKNIAAVLTMFILLSCLSIPRPTGVLEPTVALSSTQPFNTQPPTETTFPTSTKPPVSTQSLTPKQLEDSQSTGTHTVLPEEIFGVALHYYYDADHFFPASWRREPINCSGRQFDLVESPRAFLAILEFTLAYSSSFLERNLTDIYLLRDLECYGKSYGGTTGKSSLYLTVDTQEKGYTDQFLLRILHKEFSMILIRNYPYPEQEWRLINEDSFSYSENALEVVEQDNVGEQTKDLLEAGFLTRYATTSIENDFSIFAEWLFTRETELCELRKRYERINEKAYRVIEFYKEISSDAAFLECKELASDDLEWLTGVVIFDVVES